MQGQIQRLILTHDWTPQIQQLIHRILLKSSKADSFLQDEWEILEQFLAVVGGGEELWDLWTAPDDLSFFVDGGLLLDLVAILTFFILIIKLIFGELSKCLFEFSSFK